MKAGHYLIIFILTAWACSDIEDAKISDKKTFIQFYEGPYSYDGVEVEAVSDGYTILGNMHITDDSTVALLIHTDKRGILQGVVNYYPGCTGKALEPIRNNGQVSGYLIVGDSIKVDQLAEQVANIQVYSARILKVNTTGQIVQSKSFSDLILDPIRVKIDYKGCSLTFNDQGEIIVLGTYKENLLTSEKPFIATLDNNNLATQWYKEYDLVDRNYINSKSVHFSNGNIVWASAILKSAQSFSDSYLAIPFVQNQSVFTNFSLLGETTSQYFLASDLQPSALGGYGLIGSKAITNGSQSDIFFIRVDAGGNFISSTEQLIDVSSLLGNDAGSEDSGNAIAASTDGGFVLGGSFMTSAGTRDMLLVKVNSAGEKQWHKVIGGSGDETVEAIREEADGSLIICGTNNVSGLSTIFLIKTDQYGELKN